MAEEPPAELTPDDELVAAFGAAGLYEPGAEGAEERLSFLRYLAARGATIEQMVDAAAAGRLPAVAGDVTLFDFGTPQLPEAIAETCDVSVDHVLRVRVSTGLPADPDVPMPGWVAEDVQAFDLAASFFGEGPTLAFSRVMGASAARIGEAAIALFLTEIESQLSSANASPLEWAEANEQAAGLAEVVTGIMTHLVREHLALAVLRQRTTAVAGEGAVVEVAVGFCDLVNSTGWASSQTLREQADALARFETAAWELAGRHGGRVVKLIGDEAMFVAPDPVDCTRIAVELCQAIDAEPSLPPARAAVGFGPVAVRGGDYFGPLVNLVARSVKAAQPGRVVVTGIVAKRCERAGGFGLHPLDAQALRGLEEPVPLVEVVEESAH